MNVKVWGKPLWIGLHCITANYPLEPSSEWKKNYINFFTSLAKVLPCKYCRESFSQYLSELPMDGIYRDKNGRLIKGKKRGFNFLKNRQTMHYWLYLMHNKVNAKLRGQGYLTDQDPPFEEVCKKYENFRAKCGTKSKTCRTPDIRSGSGDVDFYGSSDMMRILKSIKEQEDIKNSKQSRKAKRDMSKSKSKLKSRFRKRLKT
jgi:hypothetical protein